MPSLSIPHLRRRLPVITCAGIHGIRGLKGFTRRYSPAGLIIREIRESGPLRFAVPHRSSGPALRQRRQSSRRNSGHCAPGGPGAGVQFRHTGFRAYGITLRGPFE